VRNSASVVQAARANEAEFTGIETQLPHFRRIFPITSDPAGAFCRE
jgi:hypothetical protein